jgi:hypothetical protein
MMITPAVDFKNRYVSPNITISSGLVLPQAHGLPSVPTLTQAHILCLTPELGYSAGDNVTLTQGTATGGCLLAGDSNNVTVFLQGLPSIPHKSTGTPTTITAADWKLVLRAWA